MCDIARINAEQLATVTDRLLLRRGPAKRRASVLRAPRHLEQMARAGDGAVAQHELPLLGERAGR